VVVGERSANLLKAKEDKFLESKIFFKLFIKQPAVG
jgi:hypothetical protein